jgi:hypothetical protein
VVDTIFFLITNGFYDLFVLVYRSIFCPKAASSGTHDNTGKDVTVFKDETVGICTEDHVAPTVHL